MSTGYENVLDVIRFRLSSFGFELTPAQIKSLKESMEMSMFDYYMTGYSEGFNDRSEQED